MRFFCLLGREQHIVFCLLGERIQIWLIWFIYNPPQYYTIQLFRLLGAWTIYLGLLIGESNQIWVICSPTAILNSFVVSKKSEKIKKIKKTENTKKTKKNRKNQISETLAQVTAPFREFRIFFFFFFVFFVFFWIFRFFWFCRIFFLIFDFLVFGSCQYNLYAMSLDHKIYKQLHSQGGPFYTYTSLIDITRMFVLYEH